MVLDLNFSAIEKNDVSINGLHSYLKVSKDIYIDNEKPTAYVKYTLEPDAKEWGIRSIGINITSIAASIEWYAYMDELSEEEKASLIAAGGMEMANENIEGTFEIDTTTQQGCTIETEMEFKCDGALIISEVNIDLEKKLITVL